MIDYTLQIVVLIVLIFRKRIYYYIYLKYVLYKVSKSSSTDLDVIEKEGYKELVIRNINQTHFKHYLSFISNTSNYLFMNGFLSKLRQLDETPIDLSRNINQLKNPKFLDEKPEYGLIRYFDNDSSSIISYTHKRIYFSQNPNNLNRTKNNPFIYFKRVIVYYNNGYHRSIGYIPFLSTLNVSDFSEIKSILKKIDNEIPIPTKNEFQTVRVGDVVGISVKNKNDLIELGINPQLHQITNYSDKSLNTFFSSPKLTVLKELLKVYDDNGLVNVRYDSFSLNVGYDDKSCLLFFLNRSKSVYRGDSLVFRNGTNLIYLPLKLETISFEGVYDVFPDTNTQSPRGDIVNKKPINFEFVRFSKELLYKIIQLPNFELLYHNFSTENYFKVLETEEDLPYIGNDYILLNLLTSLSKIVDTLGEFNEVIDENEPLIKTNFTTTESVFVYVMIDKQTGFYKIGISNNPTYREKTLMSQKPTIELLFKKEYTDRETSRFIESSIHTLFSNKRVRGEWFDLSDNDIVKIKSILS